MLSVTGLRVSYGAQPALAGVDLDMGQGETVALFGANGSGKTTLVRAISGVIRPSAGSITFEGHRLDRMRPSAILRAGVAQVPEGRRIFPNLTVAENLRAGVHARGRRAEADVAWVMDLFPGLRAQAYRPAGTLPAGEQQVLALGRALASRPRLVLVDELSAGISPALACQLFDILRGLRLTGVALLIVEQFVNLALDLADRVFVIDNGRITVATEPGRLSIDDVSWQSTHPGGGDGAAASRSKGVPE
jgi:branched-chain amino acid transport system ATP-binding protein